MTARSKALVCGRSPAEISGSNPTGVVDVCLLWVLCTLSGTGLCDGLITRPEESYRLWRVVVCDLETSKTRKPWPTGGCEIQPKGAVTAAKQTNKQFKYYDVKSCDNPFNDAALSPAHRRTNWRISFCKRRKGAANRPWIIPLWNDIEVATETVPLEEPVESTGRHDNCLLCLSFPVHLTQCFVIDRQAFY
jgi:hypothetical protein